MSFFRIILFVGGLCSSSLVTRSALASADFDIRSGAKTWQCSSLFATIKESPLSPVNRSADSSNPSRIEDDGIVWVRGGTPREMLYRHPITFREVSVAAELISKRWSAPIESRSLDPDAVSGILISVQKVQTVPPSNTGQAQRFAYDNVSGILKHFGIRVSPNSSIRVSANPLSLKDVAVEVADFIGTSKNDIDFFSQIEMDVASLLKLAGPSNERLTLSAEFTTTQDDIGPTYFPGLKISVLSILNRTNGLLIDIVSIQSAENFRNL